MISFAGNATLREDRSALERFGIHTASAGAIPDLPIAPPEDAFTIHYTQYTTSAPEPPSSFGRPTTAKTALSVRDEFDPQSMPIVTKLEKHGPFCATITKPVRLEGDVYHPHGDLRTGMALNMYPAIKLVYTGAALPESPTPVDRGSPMKATGSHNALDDLSAKLRRYSNVSHTDFGPNGFEEHADGQCVALHITLRCCCTPHATCEVVHRSHALFQTS